LGTPFIQEAKMGRYSIDFLLTDKRVAIEIDGIYWHRDMVKDARKTRYLNNLGWHVLRITDLEISHIQDLGSFIINSLKCITRHQSPDINPSLF
jgi:very-short-patch-repair endonuclease